MIPRTRYQASLKPSDGKNWKKYSDAEIKDKVRLYTDLGSVAPVALLDEYIVRFNLTPKPEPSEKPFPLAEVLLDPDYVPPPELTPEASVLEDILRRERFLWEHRKDLVPEFTRTNTNGIVLIEHGKVADYLIEKYRTVSFNKIIYFFDKSAGIYRKNRGILEEEIAGIYAETKAKGSITKDTRDILFYVIHKNQHRDYPFNQCRNLIPVENGAVHINYDTGDVELIPHSPDHLFTFKFPVNYDKAASTEGIDKIINSWVEPEDAILLYQIPAQAILQMQIDAPFKKAYLCQGEPNAGKTSYLELLERCFGEDNISHVSLHQITADRFARGLQEDKLLNTYDDLSDIPLENVGTLKDLTGKTHHNIERKFCDGYNGRIFAVHVFTCNKPPAYPERVKYDAAFWERWEYVRFPFFYPVNPEFYEKTYTPAFLSGFLNRIIEAMIKIRKGKKLQINRTAAEVMDRWSMESDPLCQFINEKMTEAARASDVNMFDRKKLFDQYSKFCKDEKVEPRKRITSLSKFTRDVQKYGFTPTRTTRRDDKKRRHQIDVYQALYRWNGNQGETEPEIKGLPGDEK